MKLIRPVTVALALLSTSAFATGERIFVTGSPALAEKLKETLCISMDCVGKGQAAQVNVVATQVKDTLEVKVVGFDGRVRHIEKMALKNDNVSAFDLVSATSGLLAAIENPNARLEPVAKAPKKWAKKNSAGKKQQLASKKKYRRTMQVAAR